MIVSKRILSQWIDVRKIKDQDIAKGLNSLGFEVDKIINLVVSNTHLIVGEVLKIEEHPKIKRLNVCYVSIGPKVLKIVCGANNVRVGVKVVVAQVGSKLANGMTIVDRELQGVFSHGMICSLSELGLNPEVLNQEELAGIVHLPDNAPVGSLSPLHYLDLDDTIFEVQLTINRSDCLAMYYLAQELRSYFNLPLKKVSIDNFKNIKVGKHKYPTYIKALSTLKINLLEHKLVNDNWVRRTLQLANIKPKSFFDNLINLVMLETGQPIAAFCADDLKELQIHEANKDFLSKNFQYFKNDLVFSDQNEYFSNLALSTSQNYLIEEDANSIIFVSLNLTNDLVQDQMKRNNFNPSNLFLQRLSKPIVPINYLFALKRVLFLLQQFEVEFEVVSFSSDVEYQPTDNSRSFNYQQINQLLGTDLALIDISNLLKIIDCEIIKKSTKAETIEVLIPSYRSDLNNVNDFAEEVARLVGYNNLPKVKPKFIFWQEKPNQLQRLLIDLRTYLLNYGFHQVKTYSLTNKDTLADFNFFAYEKPITLIAPINLARKAMRFSLLPSLLEICRFNASFKQDSLKIFTDEVIYTNDPNASSNANHHLAFVINNNFFSSHNSPDLMTNKANNYLLIKGFLETWLSKHGGEEFVAALKYQSFKEEKIHPYLGSEIKYNNIHFATIAALHPQICKEMALSEIVFLVEINFTRLAEIITKLEQGKTIKFQNWSKFNPLTRDLSIIISHEIDYADVRNVIWSAKTKYLEKLTLIDVYSDEKLKHDKKRSLTFTLEFNSKKEQLDEEKVSQEIKIIQTLLKERFNVVVR